MATSSATTPVRVWDVPTRLFHWLLVGLFAYSWYSGETGDLERHQLSGIAAFGLLAFRLIWGFVGGSTARFARFVRGPRAVIAYLRGTGPATAGHNPLGGWSVVVLLLLLLAQVGTGLFAQDTDALYPGPLNSLVDYDTADRLAHFHHLIFKLLLLTVAIHVAAIAFYRLRGRNLILPMLTGADPAVDPAVEPLAPAGIVRFAIAAIAAAALAWWVSKGAPI
ncbi:MAG: cytochrome b/b6 domain-containing protein [Sphingomonadales bacterium]|nr:cytochrome b/b6 domain-containing protein [Sphingomonadales bacterium]